MIFWSRKTEAMVRRQAGRSGGTIMRDPKPLCLNLRNQHSYAGGGPGSAGETHGYGDTLGFPGSHNCMIVNHRTEAPLHLVAW